MKWHPTTQLVIVLGKKATPGIRNMRIIHRNQNSDIAVTAPSSESLGHPGLLPVAATTVTTDSDDGCGLHCSSSCGGELDSAADDVGADMAGRLASLSISNSAEGATQSSDVKNVDDADADDSEEKVHPEVMPLTLRLMSRVAVNLFVRRDSTGRMCIEGMVRLE